MPRKSSKNSKKRDHSQSNESPLVKDPIVSDDDDDDMNDIIKPDTEPNADSDAEPNVNAPKPVNPTPNVQPSKKLRTAEDIEANRQLARKRLEQATARKQQIAANAHKKGAGVTSDDSSYMASGKHGSTSGIVVSVFSRQFPAKDPAKGPYTETTIKMIVTGMSSAFKVDQDGNVYWEMVAVLDKKAMDAGFTEHAPEATIRVYKGSIISVSTLNEIRIPSFDKSQLPVVTLANTCARGYSDKYGALRTKIQFSGNGVISLAISPADMFNELSKIYQVLVALPHPNALARMDPIAFYERTRPVLLRIQRDLSDTSSLPVDPATVPIDDNVVNHSCVSVLDMSNIDAVKPASEQEPAKLFLKMRVLFIGEDSNGHGFKFRGSFTLWPNHLAFLTSDVLAMKNVVNSHMAILMTKFAHVVVSPNFRGTNQFLANVAAMDDGTLADEDDGTLADEGVLGLNVNAIFVATGAFVQIFGVPIDRETAIRLMADGQPKYKSAAAPLGANDAPPMLSIDKGIVNLREMPGSDCSATVAAIPKDWEFVVVLPSAFSHDFTNVENLTSLMTREEGVKLFTPGEGGQGRAVNINGETVKLGKEQMKANNNLLIAYDPGMNVFPCFNTQTNTDVVMNPKYECYRHLVPHSDPYEHANVAETMDTE